jgi:hypothetical protein
MPASASTTAVSRGPHYTDRKQVPSRVQAAAGSSGGPPKPPGTRFAFSLVVRFIIDYKYNPGGGGAGDGGGTGPRWARGYTYGVVDEATGRTEAVDEARFNQLVYGAYCSRDSIARYKTTLCVAGGRFEGREAEAAAERARRAADRAAGLPAGRSGGGSRRSAGAGSAGARGSSHVWGPGRSLRNSTAGVRRHGGTSACVSGLGVL